VALYRYRIHLRLDIYSGIPRREIWFLRMTKTVTPFVTFSCGLILGAGFLILAQPAPNTRETCEVYKVATHAATAYVLKPPPAEQIECPKNPPAKCENVERIDISAERVDGIEKNRQVEEPRRHQHRRRHRRIRTYWR
jgi:hypothetical protein